MSWILILFLMGDDGQVAIERVEFTTKQACEAARQELQREYPGGLFAYRVRGFCFPKGQELKGGVEK